MSALAATVSGKVDLSGHPAARHHEAAGQKLGGPNLSYSGGTRETMPIAADLAAINRAGLVTTSSQPGEVDCTYRQRAAVDRRPCS